MKRQAARLNEQSSPYTGRKTHTILPNIHPDQVVAEAAVVHKVNEHDAGKKACYSHKNPERHPHLEAHDEASADVSRRGLRGVDGDGGDLDADARAEEEAADGELPPVAREGLPEDGEDAAGEKSAKRSSRRVSGDVQKTG